VINWSAASVGHGPELYFAQRPDLGDKQTRNAKRRETGKE